MNLYGLRGFTHHGGRTLTVLSPAGRTAALAHLRNTEGLRVVARPGLPTQYHEVRNGSIEALARRYGIELVDRPTWEARKAALGDDVLK